MDCIKRLQGKIKNYMKALSSKLTDQGSHIFICFNFMTGNKDYIHNNNIKKRLN